MLGVLALVAFAGCATQATTSPCPEQFRSNYFAIVELARPFDRAALEVDLATADLLHEWSPMASNFTYGESWNATTREHRGIVEEGVNGTTRLLIWRSVDAAIPPTAEETAPYDADARSTLYATASRLKSDVAGRVSTGMRGECVSHFSSIIINPTARDAGATGT